MDADIGESTLVPVAAAWIVNNASVCCNSFVAGIDSDRMFNFPVSFVFGDATINQGKLGLVMTLTEDGSIRLQSFALEEHFDEDHAGPKFLELLTEEPRHDETVPLAAFFAWSRRAFRGKQTESHVALGNIVRQTLTAQGIEFGRRETAAQGFVQRLNSTGPSKFRALWVTILAEAGRIVEDDGVVEEEGGRVEKDVLVAEEE